MNILKSMARKILAEEINEYERKIERAEFLSKESDKEIEDLRKCKGQNDELERKNIVLRLDVENLQKEKEKISKENAILKEYYKLDEEPSPEIQLRIHINLEINRLKEELLKERLRPAYAPYPVQIFQPMQSILHQQRGW